MDALDAMIGHCQPWPNCSTFHVPHCTNPEVGTQRSRGRGKEQRRRYVYIDICTTRLSHRQAGEGEEKKRGEEGRKKGEDKRAAGREERGRMGLWD